MRLSQASRDTAARRSDITLARCATTARKTIACALARVGARQTVNGVCSRHPSGVFDSDSAYQLDDTGATIAAGPGLASGSADS